MTYQWRNAGSDLAIRSMVATRTGLVDLPLNDGSNSVQDSANEVAARHSLDE